MWQLLDRQTRVHNATFRLRQVTRRKSSCFFHQENVPSHNTIKVMAKIHEMKFEVGCMHPIWPLHISGSSQTSKISLLFRTPILHIWTKTHWCASGASVHLYKEIILWKYKGNLIFLLGQKLHPIFIFSQRKRY